MIKVLTWQAFLQAQPECHTLVVGLSGGLDSQVLLHSLVHTKPDFISLHVVHIHHGLQDKADEWVEQCRQICREFQLECHVDYVDATANAEQSPEEAARDARYHAFEKYLTPGSCLVTAHHGDDQVETFLLQLMRGAGVRGLSCMADLTVTPPHWRPLLCFERADLLAYATAHRLKWIEDPSNQNCDFSRNFLRHKIIPTLKSHWPGLTKAVLRSAHHQQDAELILEHQAQQDLAVIAGSKPATINVSRLQTLPRERQLNVLRHWIRSNHLPMAPQVKLQHILSDVVLAAVDRMPLVTWEGAEIRRYREDLFVLPPLQPIPLNTVVPWLDPTRPLILPFNLGPIPVPLQPFPEGAKVEIAFPINGLKVVLAGRPGHRDFKKCCQEWGIPPWERDRVPLLYVNGDLHAIVGYALVGN